MSARDFLGEDDDDDGGKRITYLPASKTRVLPSSLAVRKWLLSVLERGHYLTALEVSTSSGQVHYRAPGTKADPDPDLQTFRRPTKIGRPPAKKRRGETDDERRRRLNRESQAKSRARKKARQEP